MKRTVELQLNKELQEKLAKCKVQIAQLTQQIQPVVNQINQLNATVEGIMIGVIGMSKDEEGNHIPDDSFVKLSQDGTTIIIDIPPIKPKAKKKVIKDEGNK
jgi:hypothetical protein